MQRVRYALVAGRKAGEFIHNVIKSVRDQVRSLPCYVIAAICRSGVTADVGIPHFPGTRIYVPRGAVGYLRGTGVDPGATPERSENAKDNPNRGESISVADNSLRQPSQAERATQPVVSALDPDALQKLHARKRYRKRDLVKRVVSLYLDQTPKLLDELAQAHTAVRCWSPGKYRSHRQVIQHDCRCNGARRYLQGD